MSFNSPLITEANQNRVIFKSCKFLRNIGAAFDFQSFVHTSFNPCTSIIFEDVSIEQNSGRPVAFLGSVNLIIRGKSQFVRNLGAALELMESSITVDGDLRFIENAGSGISLFGFSSIVLLSGSKLVLKENKGANKGGAIFVDLYTSLADSSGVYDCFLWFSKLNSQCRIFDHCNTQVHQPNATIVFEKNQAPVGGTIYGSILRNCPWAVYPNGTKPSSGVAFLQQLPSVTFNPSVLDSSVVSTDAFYLVRNMSQPIYAIPGKEIHLNITALDLFNQSISTIIGSSLLNTSSQSRLGSSGNWYLIPNRTVPMTIFGEPGDTPLASIFAIDTNAKLEVPVTLVNCSFGFLLSDNQRCLCDPDLPSPVTCDQQNFELQVPSRDWLANSPTGGYAYASCILDYCQVGTKIISDGDIDSQCEPEYNRTGRLCASCISNMSVVFGSNACRPCSSAYLASIIMYGVLGIVLVLAISFLGFSISEGYLNSLLFYCNVTSLYSSFFAPSGSLGFFLVKFVNLSMGFELCFYDGMDTLAKVGIQLLFPAYLFFIMLVIIILAKYSSKISNAGFSAAKTFSTLLLLCYTSVGETCILIVAVKKITGLNGSYWYADPTIQYGQGFHGFLVFVAVILILVYILPFSIGLLLPPLILRTRLSIMLKPLLDAFWNPFKPKFRFWIGLRAILRIIPFCFAVLIPPPDNSFWLAIFLAALLLFHGYFQPFEGKWQNFLDLFFYLNLLLLAVGTVFFSRAPSNNSTHNNIAFVSVLLALAYLIFLIIVALHINIRFPVIRITAIKHYHWLKQNLKKKRKSNDMEDDHNDPVIHRAAQSQAPMNTFSELREPFLDYEEGDFL